MLFFACFIAWIWWGWVILVCLPQKKSHFCSEVGLEATFRPIPLNRKPHAQLWWLINEYAFLFFWFTVTKNVQSRFILYITTELLSVNWRYRHCSQNNIFVVSRWYLCPISDRGGTYLSGLESVSLCLGYIKSLEMRSCESWMIMLN